MDPAVNSDDQRHPHIPALDGLRGFAVILVMLVHTDPVIVHGGFIGVDLFFVLSGFLITSILLREYRLTGRISIPRFYLRRALRLLPAMFAVVSVCFVVIAFTGAYALQIAVAHSLSAIFYYSNWFLLATPNVVRAFIHLWSLSVEEQFYLLWPVTLVFFLRTNLKRSTILTMLVACILMPTVARILLWKEPASLTLYFHTQFRIDALLLGALVAIAADRGYLQRALWRRTIQIFLPFAIAIFGYHALKRDLLINAWMYRAGFLLVALSSAVFIAAILCDAPAWWRKLFEWPPLRWVGKVSYGAYLYHWPIFIALGVAPAHVSLLKGSLLLSAAAVLLTFLIASVSYYWLEQPFLKLKERIGHDRGPSRRRTELAA